MFDFLAAGLLCAAIAAFGVLSIEAALQRGWSRHGRRP